MSKVRVHELAKELNVESKVLMTKLKATGAKVISHQSTLTDQQVAELKRAFGGGGAAPGGAAAGDGGKPKVVIRRRAAAVVEESPAEDDGGTVLEADDEQSGAAEPEDTQDEPAAAAAPPPAAAPAAVERAASPAPGAGATASPAGAAPAAASAATSAQPHVPPLRASNTPATVVRSVPRPEAPVQAPSRGPAAPPLTARAPAPPPPASPAAAAPVTPGAAAPAAGASAASPAAAAAGTAASSAAAAGSAATATASAGAPTARPAGAPPAGRPAGTPAPGRPAAPGQAAAAGAPAAGTPQQRRRDLGGATIVRKATPEEVEKLESANKSRQTGRKEDHRGTRVTGLGLLSNRVSAGDSGPGGAPGQQGPGQGPPPDGEDWGTRRGAAVAGTTARDRKAQEDAEEVARKKAAANKARRSNVGLNARALLQQAEELTSTDVDETVVPTEVAGRTVYTPSAPRTKRDIKRRKDLKKTMITTPRAAYRVVNMAESITVAELAKQLAVKATDLIKKLMTQGVMATINQSLDLDTATLLASEYHFEVKSTVETVEDILAVGAPAAGDTETRPPIVTIMGHVDHGKTSLLDAIRSADVAAGEAGGITQHIGAYSVTYEGKKIAFLDTPGHEAFSSMRARGAKVTDIVVLVVAADDGVMPQTIEAINHAKAANVPLIVAMNKIDKHNIDLDRIYTELTAHGVQAEEWGGEIQFIKTSATKKTGIDSLLEAILLQAEVLDLKASKEGPATGTVIEAHLDKGRGPVATVMVQGGTLRVGDYLVAGSEYGRVRAMLDHLGKEQPVAEPSSPVEIIGLSGVPMAGDAINAVADEKTAREATEWRQEQVRKAAGTKSSAQSLSDLLAKVKSAEIPEVPLLVKGDTQGSVEAISDSINKLSNEKVRNRIIHSAAGGVTESDITLAAASGAVIVAFNVRAARGLDEMAEKSGVAIRYFSIIYEIVDALKAIMVGKLPPIVSEVVLGHAEVRKPISVPKIGTIAGSAVLDGKITRGAHVRLLRNSIVIYTGKLGSLRRFKDDVKEVVQGYECGIGIDGYNDLKEGDVIEAFVLEETAATL